MDQFIERNLLLNFHRFKQESHVFLTDARKRQENLEPWIQCAAACLTTDTAIFHLDTADKKIHACGISFQTSEKAIRGWVLADPWASGEAYRDTVVVLATVQLLGLPIPAFMRTAPVAFAEAVTRVVN